MRPFSAPSAVLLSCLLLAVPFAAVRPAEARGPEMSEGERRAFEARQVEEAKLACRSNDANAFFGLMVQSPAVRRAFTAEKVEYSELDAKGAGKTTLVPREAYDRFPIRMVDFMWKAAQPLLRGRDEHVVMELNVSQTNDVAVDWTRVIYGPPYDGEESLGTARDLDGRVHDPSRPTDGTLLLRPRNGCWYLVADTRRVRR
ncbi:hypothetical protein [Pinisolibacter aquiterrae]|nr:hypothetical protein [Pinisolibacter aquiterrae]MBV5262478.1 hypothetical protein [Pinisolibacter aquiterrae]